MSGLWREVQTASDLDTRVEAWAPKALPGFTLWRFHADGYWRYTPDLEGATAEHLIARYGPILQPAPPPVETVPEAAEPTDYEVRREALRAASNLWYGDRKDPDDPAEVLHVAQLFEPYLRTGVNAAGLVVITSDEWERFKTLDAKAPKTRRPAEARTADEDGA